MTDIKFKFDLKEKVTVTLLGLDVYINAYFVHGNGEIQYQIEWLDNNGVVNNRYYGEDELRRF